MNKTRVLPVIFALLMISCSKKIQLQSTFTPTGINIDGQLNDWNGQANYDSESKLVYMVSHDKKYLYIGFKTMDESTKRQIIFSGFDIWIDSSAHKKHTFGLHYPIKDRKPDFGKMMNKKQPGFRQSKKPDFSRVFNANTPYLLMRHGEKAVKISPANNPELLAIGRVDEYGFFSFEVRIPMAEVFQNIPDEGKLVSLGIVFPNSGGSHMQPGGNMNNGQRGNMRGQGSYPPQNAMGTEVSDLWLKRVLIKP